MYDIDGGRVIIKYIRKRCDIGNWNVPRYTIGGIYVELRHDNWFPITNLGIPDLEKFKLYTDPADFTYYEDKPNGMMYATHDGLVRSMTYGPTENDQPLLCRKVVKS